MVMSLRPNLTGHGGSIFAKVWKRAASLDSPLIMRLSN